MAKKTRKDDEKGYTCVYPLGTLAAMKDVGLRIRIDRELREQFVKACQAEDKPAAQVIREFMRRYVASRKAEANKFKANDSGQ